MANKRSDSLTRFRELVKKDYRRINGKKREREKRDLLDWYVDNCPAHEGPETAKKFADYGIRFGYDFKKIKKRILDVVGLKEDNTYKYCSNGSEMEALIDEIEKIYSSRRKAVIYFSKGSYGEIDSLYIRIRNSFAHGNYFKVGDFYYLWNETGSEVKTKKLGAFMVLKYSDLKSIYDALSTADDKA